MKKLIKILPLIVILHLSAFESTAQNIFSDNCADDYTLASIDPASTSLFVDGQCAEGLDEYYFSFHTGPNFALELNLQLTVDMPNIYYNRTDLFGPFESNSQACINVNSTTPVLSDVFEDVFLVPFPNIFVYPFTLSATLNEGYYIVRMSYCLLDSANHKNVRLDYHHTKDIPCPIPCQDTLCVNLPCDSLPPPCWFPLVCDSCSLFPATCDTIGGPPQPPCGNVVTTTEEIDCPTCIDRFAPTPGEKYMFEAWVREEDASPLDTIYETPKIKVRFYDGFENQIGSDYVLGTSGPIIEGWQQITEMLTVPTSAITMQMEMFVQDGNAHFDDIRVSPFNSAMKTYVYDQQNMRLIAELDERNFATFYQYDEEGRMVAVKKETSRGVKTIQAIQQNTSTSNAQ